ncbi:MAG: hypothetical protein HC906_05270 [Bacteroidales bacterium]|nr:hypothetical protein [Bacteroidales bacterium]
MILLAENEIDIKSEIESAWIPEDINLSIHADLVLKRWNITSDRVFIEKQLSGSLVAVFPNARPVLTYFVNAFQSPTGNETPYSLFLQQIIFRQEMILFW